MVSARITRAQEGVALRVLMRPAGDLSHRQPIKRGKARGAAPGPDPSDQMVRRPARVASATAKPLSGPFLSPGSLTRAERLDLLSGIEIVLDGVFTHLPLKRARYGFDPVQRLRILRTQVDEFTDDTFHAAVADILVALRDAHTRYSGPASLSGKVAMLPFRVEMAGSASSPIYVVTQVAPGLQTTFKPGVILEMWNGVPIDLAVRRHSEREVGGRPDSQRAWATRSLTARPLQWGPPPDERWVVIGYRTAGMAGRGRAKEIRLEWKVLDPNSVSRPTTELSTGGRGRDIRPGDQALGEPMAVDPAAEAIRRATMLRFAPEAFSGRQAAPRRVTQARRGQAIATTVIPTGLTETLKAESLPVSGGPFGYLRIYAFNASPPLFIDELLRLIPLLPQRGLIIDIRSNPGGYILSAELALQLLTPNFIQPTRFSLLATPFTRSLASLDGPLAEALAPWKQSLDAAVRNGELYGQPIPISDPEDCNRVGQRYGGPVVLVGDSTTYSAGDLFAAGFVDNHIGPFFCVGSATGAGGANVWHYDELRANLEGSQSALPSLPDGIGLSFAFRRATRSGSNDGRPIEDVGIEGVSYAMTRKDLLLERQDLLRKCVAALKKEPFSQLNALLDPSTRTISIFTRGLDRLDVLFDGHPGSAHKTAPGGSVIVTYPADVRIIDVTGFSGPTIRQRRRLDTLDAGEAS